MEWRHVEEVGCVMETTDQPAVPSSQKLRFRAVDMDTDILHGIQDFHYVQ